MKLFKAIFVWFLVGFVLPVFAYQTVAMDFQGNWYKVNYINNERDAIVQFVRQGFNKNNWQESVVFHTFKWTQTRNTSAQSLMYSLLQDVNRKNPTMKVEYLKITSEDTLASWCVDSTKTMPAHCELLRTTQSFEGALSMHYINKNPKHFMSVRQDWINRLSKARVYQSYFRLDRIMNKSLTFEL